MFSYLANIERLRTEGRKYYHANRERYRAYDKKNREHIRKRKHAHYLANKERIVKQIAEWRKRNPGNVRAMWRKWYRNRPERIRERRQKINQLRFQAHKTNLTDTYSIKALSQQFVLEPPIDMIRAKRELLRVKRLLKENRT